jgi:hypothetical protein
MSKYRIEICEHIIGSTQIKIRETYPIEVTDHTSAIAIAKEKCREINSPAVIILSGRIDLAGFCIRDENGSIVYNSTPQDMCELAS